MTGSTSGIGLAIAWALARQHCHVMLNGFGDETEIERLCSHLADRTGVTVLYSDADVSKPERVRQMVGDAARLGSVDILVNNAGIQHVAPLESFPEEKWDALLAINLSAAFHASKAVLPLMRAKGWGRIVNIASAHGLVASPFKAAYVAAKHGLLGLTKVVALETAEQGITCNAICPGYVRTPLVETQLEDQARARGASHTGVARDALLEPQAMKRFIEADEVAALVSYLCSDAAVSVTGAAFPIDGGWTAR